MVTKPDTDGWTLAEKLRHQSKDGDRYDHLGPTGPLLREAADRIDALELALREILNQTEGDELATIRMLAREAVDG